MTDNDQNEQLELYALRLLDDAEDAVVGRLLRVDAHARERVHELRGVISLLTFALVPLQPSPQLKVRILAAAHAEAERLR